MTSVLVDASAIVDVLLRNAQGRTIERYLDGRSLVTLAHADAEVLSALARLHRSGDLAAADVDERLRQLERLPMDRLPIDVASLRTAWALRRNVAMRDALYVVAARAHGSKLITTDRRLRRAAPDTTIGPADLT